MRKEELKQSNDRKIASYQKLALFLCYPSVISCFSAISILINRSLFKGLSFFSIAYFEYKVEGYGYNDFVIYLPLIISLVVAAVSVLCAIQAVKGKLWAILVGSIIYWADLIFGIVLIIISTSIFSPIEWTLLFIIHALFGAIYVYLLVLYAKLTRLLREEYYYGR